MKKLIILFSAVVLTITAYNFYETKNKERKKDILESYRIEDNNYKDNKKEEKVEEEITTYINNIDKEVEEITLKENILENDKITLKNTFILLTDFIFFNGKIKGKTFNELKDTTKEKIVLIYERIDNKIENKIPGYKETIKENSTKTYSNLKEELNELKGKITASYREEVGNENYIEQHKIIDDSINTLKDSYSPVIDTIVEKSKKVYENTKSKADSWYKKWKEENTQ